MTYDVRATVSALHAQGTLRIELQTAAEFADAAMARIQEMFGDFLAHGPTQEELDNSKMYLLGNAALNSASNAQILRQLFSIGASNLPLELDFSAQKAQELSLESVKKALNQHFNAQGWSAVILGPTTHQLALPSPDESASNGMCRATGDFVAS
jgi:zinc protease